MENDWQPIDNGQLQSSATFYTIKIAAGGVYKLDSPFNVCKCMSANQKFKVAWSTSTGKTDFAEGWKVRFPQMIPYVQIFNTGATDLIVTLGLGRGDIDDSSMVISGTVYTNPAPYTAFTATTVAISSGIATIPVSAHTILQNTSSNIMYIGGTGTDGLQLMPNGTFEFSCDAVVTIYGTNGDTIAVGSFN